MNTAQELLDQAKQLEQLLLKQIEIEITEEKHLLKRLQAQIDLLLLFRDEGNYTSEIEAKFIKNLQTIAKEANIPEDSLPDSIKILIKDFSDDSSDEDSPETSSETPDEITSKKRYPLPLKLALASIIILIIFITVRLALQTLPFPDEENGILISQFVNDGIFSTMFHKGHQHKLHKTLLGYCKKYHPNIKFREDFLTAKTPDAMRNKGNHLKANMIISGEANKDSSFNCNVMLINLPEIDNYTLDCQIDLLEIEYLHFDNISNYDPFVYLISGLLYYQDKNWDEAAEHLELAQGILLSSDLSILLGHIYLYQNKTTEALIRYENAFRIEPESPSGYYQAALVSHNCFGDLNKAENIYKKGISSISYVDLYRGYGNLLTELEHYEEAEGNYRKALELEPDNPDHHNNLGILFAQTNRLADAEAEFRLAIGLSSYDPVYHNNLGGLLVSMERYPDALTEFEKSITLNDKDATVWYNLGFLYEQKAETLNKALLAYKKIIELEEEKVYGYLNVGRVLVIIEHYDEAESNFLIALEKSNFKNTDAYNLLGNLYLQQNKLDKAEKQYREALQVEPNSALLHNNLAYLLENNLRLKEAEEEYRYAIKLDPNYAEAYSNLGTMLYRMKRHNEAERKYRQALEIEPSNPALHYNLANLLSIQKRYEDAEQEYRQAIDLRPDYAQAMVNLASMFQKMKKDEEANYWLEEAYKHKDKLPDKGKLLQLQLENIES